MLLLVLGQPEGKQTGELKLSFSLHAPRLESKSDSGGTYEREGLGEGMHKKKQRVYNVSANRMVLNSSTCTFLFIHFGFTLERGLLAPGFRVHHGRIQHNSKRVDELEEANSNLKKA